jgi:hypothetical protein
VLDPELALCALLVAAFGAGELALGIALPLPPCIISPPSARAACAEWP